LPGNSGPLLRWRGTKQGATGTLSYQGSRPFPPSTPVSPGRLEPREAAMVALRLVIAGLFLMMLLAAGLALARRGGAQGGGERERCDKLFAAGNYKEAFEGYRRLALDPATEPVRVGGDLTRAIECLVHLGRLDEVDAFRDAVIAVHKDNWRLLQAAAES